MQGSAGDSRDSGMLEDVKDRLTNYDGLSPTYKGKFDKLCYKYLKLELDLLAMVCVGWNRKTSDKYVADTLAFYQSTIVEFDHRLGYLSRKIKPSLRKLETALDEFEKIWGFKPTRMLKKEPHIWTYARFNRDRTSDRAFDPEVIYRKMDQSTGYRYYIYATEYHSGRLSILDASSARDAQGIPLFNCSIEEQAAGYFEEEDVYPKYREYEEEYATSGFFKIKGTGLLPEGYAKVEKDYARMNLKVQKCVKDWESLYETYVSPYELMQIEISILEDELYPLVSEALWPINSEMERRKKESRAKAKVREKERRAKAEKRKLQAMAAAHTGKGREQAQTVKRQLKHSGSCPYCGAKLTEKRAHADHIYPLSKGGLSTEENMVYVCTDCNLAKRDKTLR